MNDDREETLQGEQEDNFARLLDDEFVDPGWLEPGQKVEAVIVKISGEWIFIDIGGKSEGYLAASEMLDENGDLTVKEGDTIEAFFLSERRSEYLFTTKIAGGAAAKAHLEAAYRSGIPVEGFVEKEIKGGFQVTIAGTVRGFCPFSQMGFARDRGDEETVGSHLPFKITEYGEQGRNVILSHRAVLEEERMKEREAFKESLHEGSIVRGTIVSLRQFGAFVGVGPIEGLIPVSEIGWGRVDDINQVLSVGQEVDVVAMKLDWDRERFSFSIKETVPNPWAAIRDKYPEGSIHGGYVARLAKFGAFVTLEPGVDGLIHISNLGMGKRINHPREVLSEGQAIEVRIGDADAEKRRLSLFWAGAEREAEAEERQSREEISDYRQKVERESRKSFGTLGDLMKAQLLEKQGKDR